MERTTEEKELRNAQYEMHKNFFDKTNDAIEQGFYLEAIFLEYAAIESRFEVMLGLFGCPCNNQLPDNERIKMKISHRMTCLKKNMKSSDYFEGSKLDNRFYKEFNAWLNSRNTYIHGLYKNGLEYTNRTEAAKELAEKGLGFARIIYDETHRLKDLRCEDERYLEYTGTRCFSKNCCINQEKE